MRARNITLHLNLAPGSRSKRKLLVCWEMFFTLNFHVFTADAALPGARTRTIAELTALLGELQQIEDEESALLAVRLARTQPVRSSSACRLSQADTNT